MIRQTLRTWQSLTKSMGRDARRGSLDAEVRLTTAYRNVFKGSPSPEEQEIVLADIAAKSGWNTVCHPGTPANEVFFREGARSVFGNVFAYITLSTTDVEALTQAARTEVAALQR